MKAKKQAHLKQEPPEKEVQFGNVFSELKIDNLPPVPDEEKKPVRHIPTKEELQIAQLTPQDKELLKQFGGPSEKVAWNPTPIKQKKK